MPESAAPGVLNALRRLLGDGIGIVHTRLHLLANEVEEEKIRVVGALVQGFLALACLIIGVVLFTGFAVFVFWEHRLVVLAGAATLFILLAIFFAWNSKSALVRESGLFKASLAELEQDMTALQMADKKMMGKQE